MPRYWSIACLLLSAASIATALLDMMRVGAGYITNYAADIAVPVYFYIVFSGLHKQRFAARLRRALGC